MRRSSAVTIGLVLFAAGAGTLVWGLATAGAVRRPAGVAGEFLAEAYMRAAQASFGRRVLVLHARPLGPVSGDVLEAGEATGGWALFDGLPVGAEVLGRALSDLAARAAGEWDREHAFTPETIRALGEMGVALIVVEDGSQVVVPERAAQADGLSAEPRVPALRVRTAELCYRRSPAGDLAAAPIGDPRDLLFGGSVDVDVPEPGEYVFVWPAGGATVTVDGRPVAPRADDMGRIVLDLPAGRVAVRAAYGGDSLRGVLLSAAAAAAAVGMIVLLRTLRPRLEHEGAAA